MANSGFFISPRALLGQLGSGDWPLVIDLRIPEDIAAHGAVMPAAMQRQLKDIASWMPQLPRGRDIVVSCARGLKIGQAGAAFLRSEGFAARALEGGFAGWKEAGGPAVTLAAYNKFIVASGGLWITRRRPKIDRVACPWLIKRFIDPNARFLFVATDQVIAAAERTGAIPFDIEGVEVTHSGADCSFDTLLKLFGLAGHEPLDEVAKIVRGADTDRLDLAPQAAGLLAISLGLSARCGEDDHALLALGETVYDGLYAWAAKARGQSHDWVTKPKAAVTQ